ncbi:MAG: hypothetical protein ACQESB_01215 [Elusimicrobiota bacterium]
MKKEKKHFKALKFLFFSAVTIMFFSNPLPAYEHTIEDAYVYPNPCRPGSGTEYDASYLTFARLPKIEKIEIYNIAGDHIATLKKNGLNASRITWEPLNESGRPLSSGEYIYYIEDINSNIKSSLFSIIR